MVTGITNYWQLCGNSRACEYVSVVTNREFSLLDLGSEPFANGPHPRSMTRRIVPQQQQLVRQVTSRLVE